MSWLQASPLERSLWVTALNAFLDVEDELEQAGTTVSEEEKNTVRYEWHQEIVTTLHQRLACEIQWDEFVCPLGSNAYEHWTRTDDVDVPFRGPLPGGLSSQLMSGFIILWYCADAAMPSGNKNMSHDMALNVVESKEKLEDAPSGLAQWSERSTIWFLLMRLQGWNMDHLYVTEGYRRRVSHLYRLAREAALVPVDSMEFWIGSCRENPHIWGTSDRPAPARILAELEWLADAWRTYTGPMRLVMEWAQVLQGRVATCVYRNKDHCAEDKHLIQELLFRSAEVFVPLWGETVGAWADNDMPWDQMVSIQHGKVDDPYSEAWGRAPSPLSPEFTLWVGWNIHTLERVCETTELVWYDLIFPNVLSALHGKFKDSVSSELKTQPMPLGVEDKMGRWNKMRPSSRTALAHWGPLPFCEFIHSEAFARPITEVFHYCFRSDVGGATGACDELVEMDPELEMMLQKILPQFFSKLFRVGDFSRTQWILDPSPTRFCAVWRKAIHCRCCFIVAMAGQYHVWCTFRHRRAGANPIIFCGGLVRACLTWLHLVIGNAIQTQESTFTGIPDADDIPVEPFMVYIERLLEETKASDQQIE